ncbi:uncharacterized protein LOC134258948 [Saccostrea cucullata]|uniref:uncharacterized protein LOC134258948 n=1 Tax=Saccostrea cuccullata TaxID=36930 RepID=UPI002ED176AD
MKWRSLGCPSPTVELKTLIDWGHAESRVLITEIKQDEEAESLEHITGFHCPVENCTKQFSTQRAVDDHVLMGTCSFATKERLCVTEKAKYIYAEKIMKMYPTNKEPGLLPVTSVKDIKVRLPSLPSGWALKETKGRVVFTNQQKEFMKEKFNIGKTTGNKVDPFCAAEEMRLSGKFKRADFLSGQQISSYFSRLVQLDKKTSKEDYWAAVCEENQDLLKCKIQQVLK